MGLGFSKCTGGSVDFFLPAPRGKAAPEALRDVAPGTDRHGHRLVKQLLALGQTGGRTGALLSKNVDRTVKSLHAFFSDYVRSLEWCTVQRQVLSIKFT